MTEPAPTAAPAPAEPPPSSRVAIGAGVGGASLLFFVVEHLLANDGQLAATMLTKLSPLAGPVWASWPLIVLIAVLAWIGADKWRAAQAARATEAAAAAKAAAALTGGVGEVATGLAGLRGEVHSLRGALQDHANATDARLRSHETNLGELKAEVTHVRGRVDVLERPRRRATDPRPAVRGNERRTREEAPR